MSLQLWYHGLELECLNLHLSYVQCSSALVMLEHRQNALIVSILYMVDKWQVQRGNCNSGRISKKRRILHTYFTISIDLSFMWHCDTPDKILILSPGFWGCDKDQISSGVGLRLDILAIFGLEHTAAACCCGKIYMFTDKMPKFRPKLPQWSLSHFLTFRQDPSWHCDTAHISARQVPLWLVTDESIKIAQYLPF